MSTTPEFSQGRSDAIHRMLEEAVEERAPRTTPRVFTGRRRVVLFASCATVAVLALGGAGYALIEATGARPGGGIAITTPTAEPETPRSSAPEPSSEPADTAPPGNIQGAGSPSPTPLPKVDDPTDPATWVVDFSGVGPMKLGLSPRSQAALQSAYKVNDYVGGESDCPSLSLTSSTHPTVTVLSSQEEKVAGIQVGGYPNDAGLAGPHTTKGIHAGSTIAQLKEAYPGIVVSSDVYPDHGYTQYRLSDGTGRYIVFQTDPTNTYVAILSATNLGAIASEVC
jgi:hypothetical protein